MHAHLQYVSMGIYHHEFGMLKNPAGMQNWLTWWTKDGRAVIVVPFHRSLCWLHHVHLVMFFHFCKFTVHLQYGSMGIYHHEYVMLKNPAEMRNWLARWTRDGQCFWFLSIARWCWFQNAILVMVPLCLNILQMDNSHQQVTVHQSIRYHSETKLIPSEPNPLFPTRLEANFHIFQSRPKIHRTFSLKHNKNVKHIVTF